MDERTLSPRAWMSLTWIWPLEGPEEPFEDEVACDVVLAAVEAAVGVCVPVPLDEEEDAEAEAALERLDGGWLLVWWIAVIVRVPGCVVDEVVVAEEKGLVPRLALLGAELDD